METVLEHFESNWEPVFREDEAIQEARAARPLEPFSDAYLSGMPSRKRRCVRESRPDATLDGLMNGKQLGVGMQGRRISSRGESYETAECRKKHL